MQNKFDNNIYIQPLIEGDELAFAGVYNYFHQAVFFNICKLVSNPAEAEDILQEVFILLWNSRHKLTPDHSIGGWLFSTSYYKSMEYLKKSIRQSFDTLHENDADLLAEATSSNNFEEEYIKKLDALNAAIELLPARKKLAFTLCRLQGRSYEEAAAELGISTETVKEYVKSSGKLIRKYVLTSTPALTSLTVSCLAIFLEP